MRSFFITLLFCLFCSNTFASSEADKGIEIVELTAMNSVDEVLIYANLRAQQPDKTTDLLRSGISLFFAFSVELYKTGPQWPDELISTTKFEHRMSYDTLKDNYILTFSEQNDRQIRFENLADAEQHLETINDVVIAPLSQLIPNQSYKVRMRAIRNTKAQPIGVGTILPFMSNMKAKSEWFEYEFVYE